MHFGNEMNTKITGHERTNKLLQQLSTPTSNFVLQLQGRTKYNFKYKNNISQCYNKKLQKTINFDLFSSSIKQ